MKFKTGTSFFGVFIPSKCGGESEKKDQRKKTNIKQKFLFVPRFRSAMTWAFTLRAFTPRRDTICPPQDTLPL